MRGIRSTIRSTVLACLIISIANTGCSNDELVKKSDDAENQCLATYHESKGSLTARQMCLSKAAMIRSPLVQGGATSILLADCASNLLSLARYADSGAIDMPSYFISKEDLSMRCNAALKQALQQDQLADTQLQALRSQVLLNTTAMTSMATNAFKQMHSNHRSIQAYHASLTKSATK
jgi:hypothetical protein